MRFFEGPRLWIVIALALLPAAGGVLAINGTNEAAIRAVIRLTARTSLLLFLLAFTASAVAKLWPSALSRWQRRNRRPFGLAFAFSHFIHAIVIAWLARMGPTQAADALTPAMLIFGGFGYLCIIAMAATSWDGAIAFLGIRRWRLLHLICGHYLWLQFMVSFGKRIPDAPAYIGFLAILSAAMAIRIAAMRVNPPDISPQRAFSPKS
ncbi:hypothetical protein [Terrarubrum flagellatum]|uniref:hypothetical protein n=1 Tax=Terrirubrum flagellatum TaxID=2895980 RepID=UPI0031450898